ncbi:hypothetical protein BKA82DRAFT_21656 [Pisolithus tinctorius]|uniref:Uncharacterized protein n=1 Tax=Pisolithus tinctorius Marx 270 TaxID=870435 RepID=A0A0C3P931_PISTI|nr:hypothetical protein BKA82DRAFT_21656 [Pisolithus tinctorius]KIO10005.1 hypothetical protein M404DRAFT_21656 [Pisolithus tinctorius Marx 270]
MKAGWWLLPLNILYDHPDPVHLSEQLRPPDWSGYPRLTKVWANMMIGPKSPHHAAAAFILLSRADDREQDSTWILRRSTLVLQNSRPLRLLCEAINHIHLDFRLAAAGGKADKPSRRSLITATHLRNRGRARRGGVQKTYGGHQTRILRGVALEAKHRNRVLDTIAVALTTGKSREVAATLQSKRQGFMLLLFATSPPSKTIGLFVAWLKKQIKHGPECQDSSQILIRSAPNPRLLRSLCEATDHMDLDSRRGAAGWKAEIPYR